MLATVMFFNEPFTNIVTITFSALIVIELLNVYSEVSVMFTHRLDQQAKLEDDSLLCAHIRHLHTEHRASQRVL